MFLTNFDFSQQGRIYSQSDSPQLKLQKEQEFSRKIVNDLAQSRKQYENMRMTAEEEKIEEKQNDLQSEASALFSEESDGEGQQDSQQIRKMASFRTLTDGDDNLEEERNTLQLDGVVEIEKSTWKDQLREQRRQSGLSQSLSDLPPFAKVTQNSSVISQELDSCDQYVVRGQIKYSLYMTNTIGECDSVIRNLQDEIVKVKGIKALLQQKKVDKRLDKLQNKQQQVVKKVRVQDSSGKFVWKPVLMVLLIATLLQKSAVAAQTIDQFCPNGNGLINWQSMTAKFTRCQTPIPIPTGVGNVTWAGELTSNYLFVKKPCVYQINEITHVVVDKPNGQFFIFQYRNTQIAQGLMLNQNVYTFLGAYFKDNTIFMQYRFTNVGFDCQECANINQLTKNVINSTKQAGFEIANLLIDQTTGFMFQLRSAPNWIWLKSELGCMKYDQVRKSNATWSPSNGTLRDLAGTQSVNTSGLHISINDFQDFLEQNNIEVRRKENYREIGANRRLSPVQAFNGMGLQYFQEAILLGCNVVYPINTKTPTQCKYLFDVYSSNVGAMLQQNAQFAIMVSVPVAIEQYKLIPTQFRCLDSSPTFSYECRCPGSPYMFKGEFESRFSQRSSLNQTVFGTKQTKQRSKTNGCWTVLPGIKGVSRIQTFENLSGRSSQIHKMVLEDTCAITIELLNSVQALGDINTNWANGHLKVLPGLTVCQSQKLFNMITADSTGASFVTSVTKVNNNELPIQEDYIQIWDNATFSTYDSTIYSQSSYLDNQICGVKMDNNQTILFPDRNLNIVEENCYDNKAKISLYDDFIAPSSNYSNLIVFATGQKIGYYDPLNHKFWPVQSNMPQYVLGVQPGPNDPQMIWNNLWCYNQFSYSPNLRRLVTVLFCSVVNGPLNSVQVFDLGVQIISPMLLTTFDGKLICFPQGSNCSQVQYAEHAIRKITNIDVQGQLQFTSVATWLWMATDFASDCSQSSQKNLSISGSAINSGQICCKGNIATSVQFQSQPVKLVVDNGMQQTEYVVNLDSNNCYDFQQSPLEISMNNIIAFSLQLLDQSGILNTVGSIFNNEFNATVFAQSQQVVNFQTPMSFDNQDDWLNTYWQYIITGASIFSVWMFVNSIVANCMSLGPKTPSFIFLLLGGGCLQACFGCLNRSRISKSLRDYDSRTGLSDLEVQRAKLKQGYKDYKRLEESLKNQ